MEASPGVYVILFRLRDRAAVDIGSLGMVELEEGLYAYVGSARGAGGLRGRIARHLKREKKTRWHIDYVTALSGFEPVYIVYAVTSDDAEESLALSLATKGILKPAVPRFGASDKRSASHLFRCLSGEEECIEKIQDAFRAVGLVPQAWKPRV